MGIEGLNDAMNRAKDAQLTSKIDTQASNKLNTSEESLQTTTNFLTQTVPDFLKEQFSDATRYINANNLNIDSDISQNAASFLTEPYGIAAEEYAFEQVVTDVKNSVQNSFESLTSDFQDSVQIGVDWLTESLEDNQNINVSANEQNLETLIPELASDENSIHVNPVLGIDTNSDGIGGIEEGDLNYIQNAPTETVIGPITLGEGVSSDTSNVMDGIDAINSEIPTNEVIEVDNPEGTTNINTDTGECSVEEGQSDVEIQHFTQKEAVTGIQSFLKGQEPEIGVDGNFGTQTAQALETRLKGIQEKVGLEQSGDYNATTSDALSKHIETLRENDEGISADSYQGFKDSLDSMQDNVLETGSNALDTVYNDYSRNPPAMTDEVTCDPSEAKHADTNTLTDNVSTASAPAP